MEISAEPSANPEGIAERGDDLSIVTYTDVSHINSTKRWEDIKAEFRHLYIEEGKSLDEVRQELKQRHGFKARYYDLSCKSNIAGIDWIV